MDCSSNKDVLTNTIKIGPKLSKVRTNNDKYVICFDSNMVNLYLCNNSNEYNDFIKFCEQNPFPKFEYLNLSNNNLEGLSDLRVLVSPQLKNLDLSYNRLQNIKY